MKNIKKKTQGLHQAHFGERKRHIRRASQAHSNDVFVLYNKTSNISIVFLVYYLYFLLYFPEAGGNCNIIVTFAPLPCRKEKESPKNH